MHWLWGSVYTTLYVRNNPCRGQQQQKGGAEAVRRARALCKRGGGERRQCRGKKRVYASLVPVSCVCVCFRCVCVCRQCFVCGVHMGGASSAVRRVKSGSRCCSGSSKQVKRGGIVAAVMRRATSLREHARHSVRSMTRPQQARICACVRSSRVSAARARARVCVCRC